MSAPDGMGAVAIPALAWQPRPDPVVASASVDATLEPDHAGAPDRDLPPDLRAALGDLVLSNRGHGVPNRGDVRGHWEDVLGGRLAVVGCFTHERRHFVVCETRDTKERRAVALSRVERDLVHGTLQGRARPDIATELELESTTLPFRLGGALRKLGLGSQARRLPLPIVLLALHYARVVELGAPASGALVRHGTRYVVMSFRELDPNSLVALSKTERMVAAGFARGESYQAIAAGSGKSACTVGNQLSTIYKKLRLRGRYELIRAWAAQDFGRNPEDRDWPKWEAPINSLLILRRNGR